MKSFIFYTFLFFGLTGCTLLEPKSKKELKTKTGRTISSKEDVSTEQTECIPDTKNLSGCKIDPPITGKSCIPYHEARINLAAAYSVFKNASQVLKDAEINLNQAKADSYEIEIYSLGSMAGISGIGDFEQKAEVAHKKAKEAFEKALADYDKLTEAHREAEDNITNEDWPCVTDDKGCHINRYGDSHCHTNEGVVFIYRYKDLQKMPILY